MRSEERKKSLGEVFTPTKLVAKMLKQLPEEVWIDTQKTFCDPTCGNGNFLVAVVKLKLVNATPLQALSTTYGVDIMQDNVDEARERMLVVCEKTCGQQRTLEWIETVNRNIVCHDALTYHWKFDGT